MSQRLISIPGWQSWTPCVPNLLGKYALHFYSPFGQTNWQIKIPNIKTKKPISGWCSFYCFGRNISSQKILANAEILGRFSTGMDKYLIVDDGWCSWGEWLNPYQKRFPQGMKKLAKDIQSRGCKPGIWLAPFSTNTPTGHRLPVFPYDYIIDLEDKNIQNKLFDSIKVIVEDWGYQLLKLDFLYVIYHIKRYKNSTVPDQILKEFLIRLRKDYPHIHLNICGCPLGPAVSVADSMRFSADIITPYLDNLWPINKLYHSSRLSQLEKNLEARSESSKFWLLDPDAFVCRPQTGFTHEQILKLHYLVKKANGVFFLGDDLTRLTSNQISTYIEPLWHSGQ